MSVKYFGSDALNKLIDLVKTALGLKADDSNVVHKTGNETVAGEKTFYNSMTITASTSGATVPLKLRPISTGTDSWVQFQNGSGTGLGYLGVMADNKPYFYDSGAKRLALLEETMPVYKNADITSNDCNSWTTPGIYQNTNVSNSPVSGWITVITIPMGSNNQNHCEQKLFPINSNAVYSRYRNSGTWSGWSNVSQIKSFKTSNITLSSLTWTQSSSGKYYTNADSGLSSSDKIIGIFIAEWGYMINGIIVQPYAGGTDNKIRLMSNTNSFGNAFMAFMVLYT